MGIVASDEETQDSYNYGSEATKLSQVFGNLLDRPLIGDYLLIHGKESRNEGPVSRQINFVYASGRPKTFIITLPHWGGRVSLICSICIIGSIWVLVFVVIVGIGQIADSDLDWPVTTYLGSFSHALVLDGENTSVRSHIECWKLDKKLLSACLSDPRLGIGVQKGLDRVELVRVDNCAQNVDMGCETPFIYSLSPQHFLHNFRLALFWNVWVALVNLKIEIIFPIVPEDLPQV